MIIEYPQDEPNIVVISPADEDMPEPQPVAPLEPAAEPGWENLADAFFVAELQHAPPGAPDQADARPAAEPAEEGDFALHVLPLVLLYNHCGTHQASRPENRRREEGDGEDEE